MENKIETLVDFRSTHNVVTKPFTVEELKKRENKSGEVSEKVKISLDNLIKFDKYSLLDYVSKIITGNELGINPVVNYKVSARTTKDEVIIKVTGTVNYDEVK